MSEIVRVAIGEDVPKIDWPPCCPKCESKESLVTVNSRLGRIKSMRPNLMGGVTVQSDVLYLSFPVCREHAAAAFWANKILDKSPLVKLLHLIVYCGALFSIAFVLRPKGFISDFGWFSLYPLLGLLGTIAILWAKATATVLPIRFDPDMDVFELKFLNEDYASKFRVFNRKATSGSLTEPLPWYRRSLVWKLVTLGVFVVFMAKLMAR